MILELEKSEFYKCKGFIHDEGLLETVAVIDGDHPGRVFVDDVTDPTSGFIWLGSQNGFIFMGDAENEEFNVELSHFFQTVIKSDGNEVGLSAFEAIGNHPKWNKTLRNVFGENIIGYNQKVYELKMSGYRTQNESELDQGYEVVKINKDIMVNNVVLDSTDFLRSKVLEFWPSFERYLDEGIGYAAIYENEIVSVCFSGVVAGKVHGIDIETSKNHQGKKLGQRVAHSFVRECLENHLTPYWDCMEINHPSVSIAENLGFENTMNYVWYSIPFDKEDQSV
ncbi:GNAT family N-acetyltransferase [Rossellomorea sp. YZS02]|uniref:GNAT family N-acetyltransferase n=1 Tax=Rossellomorea sp. YZS02 TaxID=3097358 RepID=UPI002A0CF393|nr:GNAT family N-acetyltransferase [Rossellomorea sp. YZS02]MDX8342249.1 GNAT family N-acetyltransferase [Rossellomorea sp. YZS02]